MRHGLHTIRSCNNAISIRKLAKRGLATQSTSNGQNIAILGGGIAGLASAYYITKQLPRAKVTVFEGSERMGGWLLSKRVDVKGGNVLFEAGPRSLRTAGNGILSVNLIDELNLEDETIFTPNTSEAAKSRYIYYPDHLVRMPHPAFGLLDMANTLTDPVFDGFLWAVLKEPFKRRRDPSIQDESIGAFLSRRLGKKVVDNIVSAIFHGIYAGDVYQLSARSLMPYLWHDDADVGLVRGASRTVRQGRLMYERDARFIQDQRPPTDDNLRLKFAKSSVFTFKNGISELIDSIARKLWDSGNVAMKTGAAVTAVRLTQDGMIVKVNNEDHQFDRVISALSPAHLNALIEAPNKIPDIPTVTVMTVNLFFHNPEQLPPGPGADSLGFGYLIPRATPFEQNPERALGVVFDNAYALPRTPERTGHVTQDTLSQDGCKVTVMLGGHYWDGWPAYPDEHEGLKMARAVLERHLNITQNPAAYQVNLQRDCIPQYTVGHQDRLQIAHLNLMRAYKGKLRVAGSWVAGVGVNDCLRSAWDAVQGIKGNIKGTGLEHVGVDRIARVKVRPREASK